VTNAATLVANGLFTVTLDFGSGVFISSDRWLEISVRTNGVGAFTTLTPRQPITPTAMCSADNRNPQSLQYFESLKPSGMARFLSCLSFGPAFGTWTVEI
jgi:hypothetical protein